ncbi:hypothetical protein HOLleu_25907 [Holothuria leucospilota]|uniref:Uncharacterized protein n=1 Tax=Holothuria leucospilota TaxID=206669 RepID=A0A9Q1BTB3_HOLLE|nr:hypothetical protein HOLleu_25907 [Holothuria leucospilota]
MYSRRVIGMMTDDDYQNEERYLFKFCCILLSGGSNQLVRADLYGALLSYLQIPYRPFNSSSIKRSTMFFQPPVSEEFERITIANLSVIEEFGEPLCSLICRDACEGQAVGRTLALSVLTAILSIDKRGGWLSFFTSRGYLRHFVESVAQADTELQEALHPSPEPLRAVYIYESTMAFLTVVAEDPVGAKALLQVGIMTKLSQAQFLDLRPEHELQIFPAQTSLSWDQYEQEESFVPTVMSRYRQLFFPVLRLCQAVLTSLGSQHNDAVLQVLNLIVSHSDVFTAILREPVMSFKLESLKELSLVTGVLGAVVGGGTTAANCQVLFTPNLTEATGRDNLRGSGNCCYSIYTSFANLDVSKPPSLGIIVRHLRQTSHEFIISFERLQQLNNKRDTLPTEEVKEVRETSVHLALLYYAMESSLFLIWRHLEYYFLHCHPSLVGSNAFPLLVHRRPPRDLTDPFSSLLDESTVPSTGSNLGLSPEVHGITKEDLQQLKVDSVSCLNETLLKRVLDIENKYGPMRRFRYAFVSAMIRRIRRLLVVDIK